MGADHQDRVELAVSRQGELKSLQTWLDLAAVPGVEVRRVPGAPGPGEQGALDVLTVLATSTGLIAAIRVLPQFLRARRSDLSVTVAVRGKKLTVDARNVEEVMPILERLLDE
ncbi:effector-associated constant component EACC1 [Streptomyces prasinosporus]